ncbi:MAG: SGNH/GDSL hydrolase family protein [Candidatus Hodarchaeales archaeon]|jgi:lysophospholipase L1-like esterase
MELLLLVFILTALASLLVLLGLLNVYRLSRILPKNSPRYYLRQKSYTDFKKKRVVLIGDSITQGRIGVNYVELLEKEFSSTDYDFINAGINSEVVWNVLQRLDEIVECNPDFIFILIGTNDVNASLSRKNQEMYRKRMKLPQLPTHEWYHELLNNLVNELEDRTAANIILLSLPPIGENSSNCEFKQSNKYNKTVKEIASQNNVFYLPLHEKMVKELEKSLLTPKYPYKMYEIEIAKALIFHYLFKKPWDHIADRKGFHLHVDYLHLNTKGAVMIAELIRDFLLRHESIKYNDYSSAGMRQ